MTEHNPSSVKTLVVGLRNEEILTFSAEGDAHLVAGFEDGLFVVKECPSGRPYGFVPEEHVLYSFVEEWTEFHDPAAEPETAVSSSIDDFLSALMTPAASSDDEGDEDDDLLPPFTDTASFSAGDKVRVSLPATLDGDTSLVSFGGEGAIEAEVVEVDTFDDTLLVEHRGKRQWIDTACAIRVEGLAEWERELAAVTEPEPDFNPGDKVRVSLPAAVNPDNPNTAFIPEHDRGDTHVDAEIIERSGPTYFVMGPDRPQFVHPSFLSLREAGE